MDTAIAENWNEILSRVRAASAGRTVQVVAVSKTVPPERIKEAFEAGVRIFGENRIQEALPKIQTLSGLNLEWHFVGHLQSNKARDAVRHFSMIHSVDSVNLMQQIEKEAAKIGKTIDLLLEINLGGEETKYGLAENQLEEVLNAGRSLRFGRLIGLMIIPPFLEDAEKVRPYFRQSRELREKWRGEYPALQELSMGMSHDYVVAIEEGATMVRIGTALFGPR